MSRLGEEGVGSKRASKRMTSSPNAFSFFLFLQSSANCDSLSSPLGHMGLLKNSVIGLT